MHDLFDRLMLLDENQDQGGGSGNENDNGGGAGGNGNNSNSNNSNNQNQQRNQRTRHPSGIDLSPNAEKALSSLLSRYDDPEYAARHLFNSRYQIQQDLENAERTIQQMQSQIPAEGAVTISGDEAKAIDALRRISPLKDIPSLLTERETLRNEVSNSRLDQKIQNIAEKTGTNFAVLNQIGRNLDLDVQTVTDPKTNQNVERVVVKTDDGKTVTEFNEYVDKHFADFKPALYKSTNGNQQAQSVTRTNRFGRQAPPILGANRSQADTSANASGGYGRHGATRQSSDAASTAGGDRSAAREIVRTRSSHLFGDGTKTNS